MKKLLLSLLIILSVTMNAQVKVKTIPVTTSSKKALALYNEAIKAFQDVELNKFDELISKALTEDPEFFMANCQSAMTAAFLKQEKNFIKFATAAVNSKAKISSGEKILKDAISLLLQDRNADLTGYGKKLVEMYPQDVNSYQQLMTFQYLIKDYDGEIASLNIALKIAERKDFLYNALAYAYMEKGKFKEAEEALDKYIELSPQLPNAYDSKGDLYMRTKEYDKAYESFMKAYSIDTIWSKGKAVRAKSMAVRLKQTDSMRKLVGTWQSVPNKDTVTVFEMIEYNNAFLQINSRIIKGVRTILLTGLYTFDLPSESFKTICFWPGGRSELWRTRFTSDKELDFSRVEDMKATNVMAHNTCTFDDPDQLIANNYNGDNVRTATSKWIRTGGSMTLTPTDSNVDQLALMQMQVGRWRSDVSEESALVSEWQRSGNVFTNTAYNVMKGEKNVMFTQNVVYSSKEGRFRSFVAYPDGNYLTYMASFNSDKKLIGTFLMDFNPGEVIHNSETNWVLGFTDPDHMIITYFTKDGTKTREFKWYRIE